MKPFHNVSRLLYCQLVDFIKVNVAQHYRWLSTQNEWVPQVGMKKEKKEKTNKQTNKQMDVLCIL